MMEKLKVLCDQVNAAGKNYGEQLNPVSEKKELMTIRFTGRKYVFKFLGAALAALFLGRATFHIYKRV